MEIQPPENFLHSALERIQNWEQHHVSRVPEPVVRKTTATSFERRAADWITTFAGSMRFVYLHTLWFGLWIVMNVGLLVLVGLNFLSPFDPFPFGLLTLVVSLEAIFLATFVMISQNRQGEIADARSQADYDVNVRAEKEVAQIMEMLTALLKYHAATAQDPLSGLPLPPMTPPTSHSADGGEQRDARNQATGVTSLALKKPPEPSGLAGVGRSLGFYVASGYVSLRDAVARLNGHIPGHAQDEAIRKVTRRSSPSVILDNRTFHRLLVDGVEVEYTRRDGTVRGDRVRLVDFDDPTKNDWVAVNQITIVEGGKNRRTDVLVFLNGLPVAVFELKDPASPNASIWGAFNQLQTYKRDIPSLFPFNELLVISDGMEARVGSLTAEKERYMRWRTIAGEDLAPETVRRSRC